MTLRPPFFTGRLDYDGTGSERRTDEERHDLRKCEAEKPVSTLYRSALSHSLQKTQAIAKYVRSYSLIMNRYYQGNYTVVDGFAGPGILDLRGRVSQKQVRLIDGVTFSEIEIGSPLLLLSNHPSIPQIHLVELDEECFKALQDRVSAYYPGRANLYNEDANVVLPRIATGIGSGKSLFLLDPAGLDLRMKTIFEVASACSGSEVLILYPTYMGVARAINVQGVPRKLDAFYGDDFLGGDVEDDGWRHRMKEWREDKAALGEELDDEGTPWDLHAGLFVLYQERLKLAGFKYVTTSPVVRSPRNRPLYHLVHAGNNDTGSRIMSDIFGAMDPPI